jgi:hypothetical protein
MALIALTILFIRGHGIRYIVVYLSLKKVAGIYIKPTIIYILYLGCFLL